jgi:UDP-N-acetylglucosamine 1-carboxyvinyltransferase
MAGALLSSEECLIHNVPNLADVNRMMEILSALGVGVDYQGHTLHVQSRSFNKTSAPYELVSQLRASFFCIGPMLARLGSVQIPLPGGCAIGARPVDLHVRGLQAMGAQVYIEHGVVHASVTGSQRRLKGAKIY